MNNLKDTLKKYLHMTPQTFSYTMIGLSTAVLVFFISYKDDDKPNSDDKPSKSDDELPEDKTLPEEDEEQFDFDKNEEPMRIGDSRVGDSRIGDSRIGGSRSSRSSRSSRALSKDKSKHGKNTSTRKKGNKKHK